MWRSRENYDSKTFSFLYIYFLWTIKYIANFFFSIIFECINVQPPSSFARSLVAIINLLLEFWTLFHIFCDSFSHIWLLNYAKSLLPCRYIKSWKLKMLSILKSPQQQAALKSSWGWLFLVKESSGHVHNRSELILYNLHPLKLTLLRIGRVLSRERVRKVCSIRE